MLTNEFAQTQISSTLKSKTEYSDIFVLLGQLSKSSIASAIVIIENKLVALNYSKTLISKTKLISIEILDNMLKHQKDDAQETPYFEVSINNAQLNVFSGNSITKIKSDFLNNRLSEYKTLSSKEIKTKYMDTLRSGSLDEKGNAGLGILTILKRTDKNYNYSINKVNTDEYYFCSEINLLNN